MRCPQVISSPALRAMSNPRPWAYAGEVPRFRARTRRRNHRPRPEGGAENLQDVVIGHVPRGPQRQASSKCGEHVARRFDDLLVVVAKVTGPCAAPEHWSVVTTALPSIVGMGVLRQLPARDCFAALSFALYLKLPWGGLATVWTQRHDDRGIVDLILRAWSKGLPPLRGSLPGRCGTFLPSTRRGQPVVPFRQPGGRRLLVLLGHFVVWTRKTSPTWLTCSPSSGSRLSLPTGQCSTSSCLSGRRGWSSPPQKRRARILDQMHDAASRLAAWRSWLSPQRPAAL